MPEVTRRDVLQMAAAAATIPHYSILDPHVHVWKHDAQFPFAAGAKVPEYDATPEALLALMKQNGIRKTVIIQVIHYRYDNSYLAAVLREYPQYFLGVCRVDPLDPAAPDHLTHWSEQKGFRGVRLSPAADANGDWIRGPLMEPLWKRCDSLKVPMTLLAPISRIPDCQKLIDRLHGDGWVGRVLENLDWHFEARNGPMVVSNMSHRNSILWFAEPLAPGSDCGYDGKMMLRKSFKDPNKAVQAAIEHITQKLEELNAHYGQLERLIK